MRRVSSRLQDNGFSVLVASGVLLMLSLCICVFLPHTLTPEYGLRVRPETTSFKLGEYDRVHAHIISVTAGETPMIFDGSERLKGGFLELKSRMDRWRVEAESPDRVTVVLVVDRAVSVGTVQRLTEMTLSRGFRCSYANIPQVGS